MRLYKQDHNDRVQEDAVLEGSVEIVDPCRALQQTYIEQAALALAVYGMPLVENMRLCRHQTVADGVHDIAVLNTVFLNDQVAAHDPAVIASIGSGFVTLSGWMDLNCGPVTLRVPAQGDTPCRYSLVVQDAFGDVRYDASQYADAEPATLIRLLAPEHPSTHTSAHQVRCGTQLARVSGVVYAEDPSDMANALRFAKSITVNDHAGAVPAKCLEQWVDTGDADLDFFQNLFAILAEFPPDSYDRLLLAPLRRVGVKLERAVNIATLKPYVLNGMRAGYAKARALVKRVANEDLDAAAAAAGLGPWGARYLQRAASAQAMAARDALIHAAALPALQARPVQDQFASNIDQAPAANPDAIANAELLPVGQSVLRQAQHAASPRKTATRKSEARSLGWGAMPSPA